MNKRVGELRVVSNTQLNHDNYLINLQADEQFEKIEPGQFVNILVKDTSETYLRRPFSIHKVDYKSNSFSVVIKTVGNGTKKLVQTKENETLNVIYPLGKGFTSPQKGEKILLIGGGVGIAPMMFLAEEAKSEGVDTHIILGARSKIDHVLLAEFEQFGVVHITTNDGTFGTKGFVTDHEIFNSDNKFTRVYCCGPEPMMFAVAKKAKALNIDCEVSLENMMACGFGVCLCCVTKTKEGNKCVCTEGPVFNINDLEWQI